MPFEEHFYHCSDIDREVIFLSFFLSFFLLFILLMYLARYTRVLFFYRCTIERKISWRWLTDFKPTKRWITVHVRTYVHTLDFIILMIVLSRTSKAKLTNWHATWKIAVAQVFRQINKRAIGIEIGNCVYVEIAVFLFLIFCLSLSLFFFFYWKIPFVIRAEKLQN